MTETLKSEGEKCNLVYINEIENLFYWKRTKEYLKTIPADNLMKNKVICKSYHQDMKVQVL